MSKVDIVSMNCRGLANKDKRHELFQFLKLNKYHICCLQDTHFIDLDQETLRERMGWSMFF